MSLLLTERPIVNKLWLSLTKHAPLNEPGGFLDKTILYMVGLAEADDFVRSLMWPGPMPQLELQLLEPCEAYSVARLLMLNWPSKNMLNTLRTIKATALERCGQLDRLRLRLIDHDSAIETLGRLYEDAFRGALAPGQLVKLAEAMAAYGLYSRAIRLLEAMTDRLVDYPVDTLRVLVKGVLGIVPWHRGLLANAGMLDASNWMVAKVRYRDRWCIIIQFRSLNFPYTISNCPIQVEGGRLVVNVDSPRIDQGPLRVDMRDRDWGIVFVVNDTDRPIKYMPEGSRCHVKARDYESSRCINVYLDVGEYASIYYT